MFIRIGRNTALGFMAIALTVMAIGCSNDNPVAPTSPNNDATTQTATGDNRSGDNITLALGDPAPPAEGIVVEGVSVPGVALGYTRAEVEDAYGDVVLWCQSTGVPGNNGFCAWAVSGGGQVDVHFAGADGGTADGTPDDVVSSVSWFEAVSGWVTTAGVNTTLADENPEAAAAAYPDARVTYNQWGGIYSIVDYEQGIAIYRPWILYSSGEVHVRMQIFYPSEAPPLPEKITYVYNIDLLANKVKGKRQIRAWVGVRNQAHLAASGATVYARWTYPDGSTQTAESVTFGSGNAYFEINNVPRGTYTLTVEDIVLEDHRFDDENSVLSESVKAK
ncbi:MAG: hypothetical protein OEV49_05275 [candidate division Zixibacteria bacterium]|nr:hypothetical protein [candidate division Zixibacteria bacterium]MDH3937624.1 hypothetical protein [candidate division Zixibacteria bacterium]MDH4032389.1 hypothetical protein [candidate division Zixibacteria bacterium]